MFGILVFGDSIGHGRGENPSHGWVGRLKNFFEEKEFFNAIYNLSIPGETSYSLLKRMTAEAKPRMWYRKDDDKYIIILSVGGNDSAGVLTPENHQVKPEDFRKNMLQLITQAKALTPTVVVLGIGPVDERKSMPRMNHYFQNHVIQKYNQILADCATEEKVLFIPVFDELLSEGYIPTIVDGVHPRSEGYNKIYKIIQRELIKNKILAN